MLPIGKRSKQVETQSKNINILNRNELSVPTYNEQIQQLLPEAHPSSITVFATVASFYETGIQNHMGGGFPGGPGAKTLCSCCTGLGFDTQ